MSAEAEITAVLDGKRRSAVVAGDCIDVLRALPADSVSAAVTDPPYGLSAEPDAAEVLRHWLAGDRYEHKSSGFMGTSWDSFVPGPEYWREVFRVLKPGGHLLAFAATRTWDLMSIAIRLAGFQNRDTIRVDGPPALGWKTGQGFAKGLNVGKAIDKAAGAERETEAGAPMGTIDPRPNSGKNMENAALITAPATVEAAEWEGWNTNLKPSWEVILLFRKPLSEPTVAANVLAHGTGALNIDACRVDFAGADDEHESKQKNQHSDFGNVDRANKVFAEDGGTRVNYNPEGRWPPNAVIVHDARCQRVGTKRVAAITGTAQGKMAGKNAGVYGEFAGSNRAGEATGYADADGMEEISDWRCVDGCAAAALDAQSGVDSTRPGQPRISSDPHTLATGNGFRMRHTGTEYSDQGGASRFVPQFQAKDPDPFLYEAKAPAREKFLYCAICRDAFPVADERKHVHGRADAKHIVRHPTQKPLSLMRWIVRLCCAKDGVVLDPFCGSGTTGVACSAEGMRFIGIELDPAHAEMARRRIEADSPLLAFAERAAAQKSEATAPAAAQVQEMSETTEAPIPGGGASR